MTLGDLKFVVSAKMSLTLTPGDDEVTLMNLWANAGVVDVLKKTHIYADVGNMALTVGQDTYRTDPNILAVLNDRITSQNQRYIFEVVPMSEILELQRGTSGSPFPYKLAIEGNLMIVFPIPQFADTIMFVFVPRPTQMTLDAHDPSLATYGGIPTEYHRAIEYYMLWQASEYGDKSGVLKTDDYHKLYMNELNDIKKGKRQQAGRGLRPARVGYPGTGRYPQRNDVYPGGNR